MNGLTGPGSDTLAAIAAWVTEWQGPMSMLFAFAFAGLLWWVLVTAHDAHDREVAELTMLLEEDRRQSRRRH